ncbi:hypothetical protein SAMN05216553_11234 [Lentzea fradiae]|uniref:Bacterial Pleckstrin homology domain-containing protein n=1 Tax=Lentzea fradiae TaxID=200378 RepID=A0A1G7XIN7_9PSEU|nr:hypothetical protein [Lentzea fradiae]SDG83997.1 hypothetical protein SAMN05216553_11234 [Lentzea fradiae]
MAVVSVQGTDLMVEMQGLDKLWALKSQLTIPLANVRGATVDPGIVGEPKGIRAPGTHVPKVITAGTFHREGEKVFWAVRNAQNAVVVELADEDYTRLVVEVDDPRAVVAMIEEATSR